MPDLALGAGGLAADLIVFDKDGVLLDFHHLWAAITRARADAVAEAAGEPALAPALLDLLGLTPEDRVRPDGLLAVGSQAESTLAAATFLHQRGRAWHRAREAATLGFETAAARVDRAARTRALPGVPAAVRALHAAGFALAIATTDQTDGAWHFLRQAGLDGLFTAVVGVDRVAASKPDPAMFALACAEAGVAPGRAVMVGDVDLDLLMGRAGGAAATVAVLSGVGDRAMLAPLADHVLAGVADLAPIGPG